MNVMNYDLSHAERVAFASSEGDGRERFTELAVYYNPHMGRPWIAEARGCSKVPGEVPKVRRLASANLDKALRLFDDSDLGIIAKEEARETAEERGWPQMAENNRVSSDRDRLAFLMGVSSADLSINATAAALGVGESSLRMALKDGRELRIPLSTLFPFIDRAAFQRARTGA